MLRASVVGLNFLFFQNHKGIWNGVMGDFSATIGCFLTLASEGISGSQVVVE